MHHPPSLLSGGGIEHTTISNLASHVQRCGSVCAFILLSLPVSAKAACIPRGTRLVVGVRGRREVVHGVGVDGTAVDIDSVSGKQVG